MSFKILAIRPLSGNDTSTIKNLNPNYLYPLYNSYTYSNDKTDSIIINQQGAAHDYFEHIDDVACDDKRTNFLFGDFIEISAIVGKNGSGKSTILELLYAYLYNISVSQGLIEFTPETNTAEQYKNLHLELILEIDQEYFSIVQHCRNNGEQTDFTNTIFKIKNGKIEITDPQQIKQLTFYFYSIVLNYSLYGLNSEILGDWINGIFHKNDGYQTPIVINPYREDGVININTEFFLAQSRLILYYFQIDNKDDIVDKIKIDSIIFSTDLNKHQFITEDNPKINIKTFDLLLDFVHGHSGIELYDVLKWTFNITGDSIISRTKQNELLEFFETLPNDSLIIRLTDNASKNQLQYLCFLYIFKKLRRISKNYEKYKPYSFLFQPELSLTKSLQDDLNVDKQFTRIFELNEPGDVLANSTEVVEYVVKKIQGFIKKIYGRVYPSFDLITKEDIVLLIQKALEVEVDIDINISKLKKDFIRNIGESVEEQLKTGIADIFVNYTRELAEDNSHITFKLKQAINYYKNGTFDAIKIDISDSGDKNTITINKNFFNKRDIRNIPLAFFDPQIMVIKDGQTPFPFDTLSSGEQQFIHTILSVNYHIFNLLSVTDDDKITYSNIHLIFDEIELYFHPEFQRKFISVLIKHLKRFKEIDPKIYFNVLFSTHSPFILSDIPSQCTLKLSEGMIKESDDINSFGANIHDLLADEFFLEEGNIGDFAAKKINDIYDDIESASIGSVSKAEYDSLKDKIELIGEPVLREPLLEFWKKKFKLLFKKDNDRMIEYHKMEIEKLQKQR